MQKHGYKQYGKSSRKLLIIQHSSLKKAAQADLLHHSSEEHILDQVLIRVIMRDGLNEPARGKWILQKLFRIVTRETPTTTSFPTCRKRHRYRKAAIASTIVLNNGDSDSRKGNY